MKTTSLPEGQLVSALHSGQKAAFTALYDAYAPALLGVILRLVKDQPRAEDLLQDAFIKIWTHRHQYDPLQGRLFTWLVTIARNVALDELRRCKVQTQAITHGTQAASAYWDSGSTEGLAGRSVFSLVPPKYRQVVELVYGQQWTHHEVAQELNLPLGTVKTYLRTALRELRLLFHQDITYYQAR
jgi:DNA-directed RNA polymerase specialized sigma24 family protein